MDALTLLSAAASGLAVLAITWLADRLGGTLGGLLATAPVTTTAAMVYLASVNDTQTMADAASQKLAHDLARAEARKTLWETELAGLAARREDDAAAAAAAVKESVLAREAADPLMTVHGDADGNPYARPARGGGGCAVM